MAMLKNGQKFKTNLFSESAAQESPESLYFILYINTIKCQHCFAIFHVFCCCCFRQYCGKALIYGNFSAAMVRAKQQGVLQ